MRFGELQFCCKQVSLFKITIALTRESRDNVGTDIHTGNNLFCVAHALLPIGCYDCVNLLVHRALCNTCNDYHSRLAPSSARGYACGVSNLLLLVTFSDRKPAIYAKDSRVGVLHLLQSVELN